MSAAKAIPDLVVGENGWSLPAAYATQPSAILAATGAGKSNLAVVIAEELYERSIPWCAVDPKGDWWGVGTSGDGQAEGLSVVVFGGEHGHLALEPSMGKAVARVVAEERLTCILDLSEFDRRQQMFTFLADFATTLLRLNRHPLHVFAEECDDYLPQTTRKEGGELPRCIGAWARLVKRGRQKGIGSTQISQRAASVTWDTLGQAQNLFALRVTAARDVKAVGDWIFGEGRRTAEEQETLRGLRSLGNGEALFWSPAWLGRQDRVQVRRRRTFDSGATPELGQAPIVPATRASVDLEALGAELAAAVERQRANDPDELRRQLAQAQARVRALEQRPEKEVVDVRARQHKAWEEGFAAGMAARQPAISPDLLERHRQIEAAFRSLADAMLERFEALRAGLAAFHETMAEGMASCSAALEQQTAAMEVLPAQSAAGDDTPRPDPKRGEHARGPNPRAAGAASARGAQPPPPPPSANGERPPPRGKAREMLAVLAHHPEGLTKRQLAARTGTTPRKSTLRNALSELRQPGYIAETGDLIRATGLGLEVLGPVTPLPRGPALLEHWHRDLGDGAEWRILTALLDDFGGEPVPKAELAAHTGIDPAKSTLRNALSRLRTLDLIDETPAGVSVSRELQEAIW